MRQLRCREIFTSVSLTLRVVELIDIERSEKPAVHYVLAQASPIAIVIDDANGRSAVDVANNPLSVEKLADKLPELDDWSQTG